MLISLIKASHPSLWLLATWLFLFGAYMSYVSGAAVPLLPLIVHGVWFTVFSSMLGYLINNYFDRALDIHNPRKRNPILHPGFYLAGVCFSIGALVIVHAAFFNFQILIWVLIAVLINLTYSAPPLRLKEVPVLDLLVGPGSTLPILFSGYALGGGWPALLPAVAGFFFFCAVELSHKTLDIEADMRGRVRTSATAWGRASSLQVAAALMLGAGLLMAIYNPYYGLGVIPYLAILFAMRGADTDEAQHDIDRRLPGYYLAAGFIVTAAFAWL